MITQTPITSAALAMPLPGTALAYWSSTVAVFHAVSHQLMTFSCLRPTRSSGLIVGDEVARSSPGLGEPLCAAGNAENRQGRPQQRAEEPGSPPPPGHRRPVRRQRRPLTRRVRADIDPVRDRRLWHAVPAHLIETVTGGPSAAPQLLGTH
jgi:hypothetical protein